MSVKNRRYCAGSALDGLGPTAALVAARQSILIAEAHAWRLARHARPTRPRRRWLRWRWRPDWTLPAVLPSFATLSDDPS